MTLLSARPVLAVLLFTILLISLTGCGWWGEPTPEPVPPTPTPEEVFTPPGWKRVEHSGTGFSIALPPAWAAFDLEQATVEDVAGAFVEMGAQTAAERVALFLRILETEENYAFLAVDMSRERPPDVLPTHANVARVTLPQAFAAQNLADILAAQLYETEDVEDIKTEVVQMGDQRVVRINYHIGGATAEAAGSSVRVYQYVYLYDTQAYTLTFALEAALFDQQRPLLDEIASTFVRR